MNVLLVTMLLMLGGTETDNYKWSTGTIITSEGQKLECSFTIVNGYETLLIKKEKGYKVIPAFKISSAFFYDHTSNIFRRYKVIANLGRRGRSYAFYEVVVSGKMDVIRKKKISKIAGLEGNGRQKRFAPFLARSLRFESDGYDYFIHESGELTPLHRFRKEVLSQMLVKHNSEIKKFIKSRSIHKLKIVDCVRLVCFYNELEQVNRESVSYNY